MGQLDYLFIDNKPVLNSKAEIASYKGTPAQVMAEGRRFRRVTSSAVVDNKLVFPVAGNTAQRWVLDLDDMINVVTDCGADPTGQTDSRLAFQMAVDSPFGEILIPDGNYLISLNYAFTTPDGGTGIGINMRSQKSLYLRGRLKLKDGSAGASSAIIGNSSAVSKVNIIAQGNGMIDGNRNNVTGQTMNACLFDATDCSFQGLRSDNSSFLGLSFRGSAPGSGRNEMVRCKVNNTAYIGIQVAKPTLGFTSDLCEVRNSGDNAFDIEGNNEGGDPAYGSNIKITNFYVNTAGNGIFLESVGNTRVFNGKIENAAANAIYLNRIQSGSFDNEFIGIRMLNTPGGVGVNFNSYVGRATVDDCYFENFSHSIALNGGATDVVIGENVHRNISKFLVVVPKVNNSAVHCRIKGEQTYMDGISATGFPFLISPLSNAFNAPGRSFGTTVAKDGYSVGSGIPMKANYIKSVTNTATNSNWAAYSIFFNGSKTLVWIPNSPPQPGDYVKINNEFFFVQGINAPGEYILQKVYVNNGAIAYQDGDFTSITNGNYPIEIYYPAWMTE